MSRPDTVADRSDDVLVTSTEYDDAGQAYKTIDPAGREDRREFDDLGRVTKTVQNYVDGTVDEDYPDEDVTVETTYNANGLTATLTAKNPTTGDQVTTCVYGTTLEDSDIASSLLKRAEIYPVVRPLRPQPAFCLRETRMDNRETMHRNRGAAR